MQVVYPFIFYIHLFLLSSDIKTTFLTSHQVTRFIHIICFIFLKITKHHYESNKHSTGSVTPPDLSEVTDY